LTLLTGKSDTTGALELSRGPPLGSSKVSDLLDVADTAITAAGWSNYIPNIMPKQESNTPTPITTVPTGTTTTSTTSTTTTTTTTSTTSTTIWDWFNNIRGM